MELFSEGSVRFYAEDKQLKSAEVFYNPRRIFDRDLNVLLFSSMHANNLKGLELFSGSGVRGLRICSETGKFGSFTFNDIKTASITAKNLWLNRQNYKCTVKVTEQNSKFYDSNDRYDYVDLDPFGSPVPYIETALRLLDKHGILAVSATDTAALLGSAQKACVRKYGSKSLRTSYSNELGIRILIKRIAELSEKFSMHARPILFNFNGNFIRVYFHFSHRKQGKIGYSYQCSKCPSRSLKESKTCGYCGASMVKVGPLWLDSLYSRKVVKDMLDYVNNTHLNSEEQNNNPKKYLEQLSGELNIFSYYTTSELSSFFKKPEERVDKFKNKTVLSPKGFRTNLNFKKLVTSIGY